MRSAGTAKLPPRQKATPTQMRARNKTGTGCHAEIRLRRRGGGDCCRCVRRHAERFGRSRPAVRCRISRPIGPYTPAAPDCSQNARPYFEAACLRDTRNPFGQARGARIVSPDRKNHRALKPSASAQKISLIAHAFQDIGINGNDLLPARVLDVSHLHRNVGVVRALQLLCRLRAE